MRVTFFLCLSNMRLLRLLGRAKESVLFGLRLEATVSKLGGGIDELELNLFQSRARGLRKESLAQGDDTLLGTDNTTLDHDEVVVNNTVMRETTQGCDGLVGDISGGGGVVVNFTILANGGLADHVNLLVDLGTVVETVLTSAGNGELHARRVPGTDTGDLAETAVSLTGKTGDAPTGNHTFVTVTLGNTNGINHLVGGEDSVNGDGVLEKGNTPVDLVGDVATVDLDLHQMSLLLTKVQRADLGVSQDADNLAVLLDAVQLGLHVGVVLVTDARGVAGERLSLAAVPVLVKATLQLNAQVLHPHGGKGTETTGGLDVTNQTHDLHGGGLDDGHGLDGLLFVDLGSGLVDLTQDVSHTGLVTQEGGQMTLLLGVILREGADATTVVGASLAGQETQGPVTGSFVFTVRHD